MSMGVQIYLRDSDFITFECMSRSNVAELCDSLLFFSFLKKLEDAPFYKPQQQCTRVQSSLHLCQNLSFFCLFSNNHFNKNKVIPYCSFDFHFPVK